MGRVDAEQFGKSFIQWMQYVFRGLVAGETVAIDGKTVCSADKLTSDGSVLHIASAIVSELGLVIGSCECGTKTGETTAFRELIALLDVAGVLVVADALHCRKKSAQAVIEAGADYLFVVKDNQPTLRENIELYSQGPPRKTHGTGLTSSQRQDIPSHAHEKSCIKRPKASKIGVFWGFCPRRDQAYAKAFARSSLRNVEYLDRL